MCPADVFWPRWLREDEESLIFNAKVNLVSTTEFNIKFPLALILNDIQLAVQTMTDNHLV